MTWPVGIPGDFRGVVDRRTVLSPWGGVPQRGRHPAGAVTNQWLLEALQRDDPDVTLDRMLTP